MCDYSWCARGAGIPPAPVVDARITEILFLLPRFRSLDPFDLRTVARHLDEIADYAETLAKQQENALSDEHTA